jgi:hypothetical protein
LIPDGISRGELVELLSRITIHTAQVHMEEELRTLVFQCLMQNIVVDFPVWREDFLYGKSKSFIFYVAIVLSVTKVFSQEVF